MKKALKVISLMAVCILSTVLICNGIGKRKTAEKIAAASLYNVFTASCELQSAMADENGSTPSRLTSAAEYLLYAFALTNSSAAKEAGINSQWYYYVAGNFILSGGNARSLTIRPAADIVGGMTEEELSFFTGLQKALQQAVDPWVSLGESGYVFSTIGAEAMNRISGDYLKECEKLFVKR